MAGQISEQKMTGMPKETSKSEQKLQKSGGFLNMILLVGVIGLTVLGGLFYFQKGQVLNHTTELEKDLVELQKQLDEVKSTKVEFSKNASDALEKIEAEEIRWSEVIGEINKLLPVDASGNRKINVLSYAGSGLGRVAVNMVTAPVSEPPFADVAQLIASFNNNVYFRDVYVPSISRGLTEDGTTTLSFVLNMDFEQPETGADSLNVGVSDISSSTDSTPRVPRNPVTAP